MIRALCKNQTFMLRALDGSIMFTRPGEVNEIPEKFTVDATYKMAVEAGALEPFTTEKEIRQKAARTTRKNDKADDGK